jgi:glycosyltransferase involved in cell wall biosynthesis
MTTPPLLSIIIPTCNRKSYLKLVVKALIDVCPSSQIIVSDNSDDNSLQSELQGYIETQKIVYIFHAEKLSVVANFERSLMLANGRYVMYLGDDDCVGPQIENITAWADSNNIDTVISYRDEFLANYFWPGVTSKYFTPKYAEHLFVNEFNGNVWKIDSRDALKKICQKPGVGMGSLPRIYQGIVRKSLIDKIVNKYGSLFGGVSPDIYSGALIAYEAKLSYVVNYPFVIPGGSPQSTAGMGASRVDVSNLYEFDHIKRFGSDLRWDDQIPKFYSSATVWANSLQQALIKIDDKSYYLNYARLYARCLLYFFRYRKFVFDAIGFHLNNVNFIKLYGNLITSVLFEVVNLGKRIFRKLSRKQTVYLSILDIESAYNKLQEHINEKAIRLNIF